MTADATATTLSEGAAPLADADFAAFKVGSKTDDADEAEAANDEAEEEEQPVHL